MDKILLFDGWRIGGLFLIVKKYFASVLHKKAGAGERVGKKSGLEAVLLKNHPIGGSIHPARRQSTNIQGTDKINHNALKSCTTAIKSHLTLSAYYREEG
jgi:hypothetical protein